MGSNRKYSYWIIGVLVFIIIFYTLLIIILMLIYVDYMISIFSFFPSFCVPPTAILPSAIILPIMAVQKRSGAAPSKPNTGPTGPIFACARAQDPRHA